MEQSLHFLREEVEKLRKEVEEIKIAQHDVLTRMSEFIRFVERDRQEYIDRIDKLLIELENRPCITHAGFIESMRGQLTILWTLIGGIFISMIGTIWGIITRHTK